MSAIGEATTMSCNRSIIRSFVLAFLLVVACPMPAHAAKDELSERTPTAERAILEAAVGGAAGAIIAVEMGQQLKELRKSLPGATIAPVGEGFLLTFSTDLVFESGATALRPTALPVMGELVKSLNQYENSQVLVVGHTDDVGSEELNRSLSQKRAEALAAHLVSRGLDHSRIAARGMGSSEPAEPGNTPEARKENRRVAIAVYASKAWQEEAEAEARVAGKAPMAAKGESKASAAKPATPTAPETKADERAAAKAPEAARDDKLKAPAPGPAGMMAKRVILRAGLGGGAGAIIKDEMGQQIKELEGKLPGAKIERVGEGFLVTFPSETLFESGSAALRASAHPTLNKLVKSLNAYENSQVLVVGHTDSAGSQAENQALSRRRAAAVAAHLESRGLDTPRIAARGVGAVEPVVPNDTPKGRRANHRVEIAVYASKAWQEEAKKEASASDTASTAAKVDEGKTPPPAPATATATETKADEGTSGATPEAGKSDEGSPAAPGTAVSESRQTRATESGGTTAKRVILGAGLGGGVGAIIKDEMGQQIKDLEGKLPGAKIERVGEGFMVTFPSETLFEPGSAGLRASVLPTLDELVKSLNAYENSLVLVVGHTDNVGGEVQTEDFSMGKAENQSLSQRRADAVSAQLVSQGLDSARLTARGVGGGEPVKPNDTPEGRQANQRVEIAMYASKAWQEEAKAEAPGSAAPQGVAGTPVAEAPKAAETPAGTEKSGVAAEEEPEEPLVKPTLRAGVLPPTFVLDGRLDEAAWQTDADSASSLETVEPEEGEDPKERTVVRVLADRDEIVVGVRCYDDDPKGIVAYSKARDSDLTEEDHVMMVFDTFNDGRSGYVFAVNPAGSRFDGLVAVRGEEVNSDWDALWEAKTSQDPGGWSAEFRIPIKSLGFKKGSSTWGFNIQRRVQRFQETSRWSSANQDYELFQTSRAGFLSNLPAFDLGVGLNVRPAVVGKTNKPARKQDMLYDGDLSLDVSQRLGSNLLSELTVNTDFGETEVDVRQINLSRFPVLFPEKRSFFLEGSDIFEFGVGLDEDLIPFFSRRIGLLGAAEEDLTPVPINVGGKVLGRVNNTNVAGLVVNTRAVERLLIDEFPVDVPQTTVGAVRVKQNVLKESAVGFLATAGEQAGRWNSWTAGVDFTYQTSSFLGDKNMLVGAWGLLNDRKDLKGDKSAYGFELGFPNDLLDVALFSARIGDAFDPSLGFVPRNNVQLWKIGGEFNPRPSSKTIIQMFHELSLSVYENLHTEKWESYELTVKPIDWLLGTGDRINLAIQPQGDRPLKVFEITSDVDLPGGQYEWTRFILGGRLAEKRKVGGELLWETGGYYTGDLTTIEARLTVKPSSFFLVELNREINRGTVLALENIEESAEATKLDKRRFREDLLGLRVAINFSPELQFSSLSQYETSNRSLGSNNRLRWTFLPAGDLFVVYNHNLDKTRQGQWRFNSNQSLVKIEYALQF